MGSFFMIVLNKKKIRLTIFIVFVLAFGFAILRDSKESVPTVSLPISGKTIVIDARTSENQMKVLKVAGEQRKRKQI